MLRRSRARREPKGLAKRGALGEREFRLLFIGQSVSLLGDQVVPLALSFAVLDLTGSVSDLGFVLAASTGTLVAFLLVGGVYADRFSGRGVMVSADLVRLASQGVMGRFSLLERPGLAARSPAGGSRAASGFFNPASIGLMPKVVSPARLQEANALRGLAMAGSGIAGPALAGGLVATVGSGWALAADAATFAVSAVFLASLRLPAHERLPAQPFVQDLLDGWREFRARTWVWVFVLYASLANMMLAPFIVLGATIAKRSLGGPGAWALILAAFGLGSFVGGLVVLRIRPRRPLFVAALTVSFVAFPSLLLASGASAEAVAVASFLAGGGLMLANVLWETTLQQHVPPASLSRVSAYDWFGSLAFRPVGFALVGPVSLRLGTEGTLWLAAGWLLVSGAAVLAVPSVRRVEARIDPQSRAPAETLGSPRESFDPER